MASNIRLYSVPGISPTDEPMFDSALDFYGYINQWGYAPDEGFFVPKFKDTITLDVTTFPFTGTANYASIYYASRYYFYFIEDMRYMSEDLVEIDIVMDVIQTYAYDIRFYKYERTRKLINRWISSNIINRSYIRENFSEGLMQLERGKTYDSYNKFSNPPLKVTGSPDEISGIIVQVRTNYTDFDTDVIAEIEGDAYSRKEYGSYVYSFNPLLNHELDTSDVKVYQYPLTDPDQPFYLLMNPYNGLKNNIRDSELVNAYYLPFNPVYNFSHSSDKYFFDNNAINIGDNMMFISSARSELDTPATIRIVPYYDIISYGFTRNTSPESYFSPLYVPAMLDENYIRISFGEGNIQATFPLYMATIDSFTCTYVGNPFSGARYYRVTAASSPVVGSKLYQDKFLTSVCATNPLALDIVTSSWRDYWAYNKASLGIAFATTAIRAFTTFGVGSAVNAITNYSGAVNYRLNAGDGDAQTRILAATNREINTRQAYDVGRVTSDVTSLSGAIASAANAAFAPDSAKSMGTYWTDLLTGTAVITSSWYRVNDFEEVARHYESVGYRVHELIHSTGYGGQHQIESPWVRTRYYYDVVSIDNIAYFPDNFPLTTELDELIRDRFRKGFRAWHHFANMGRIGLYIDYRNLIMGCTCVYDNPEV